MMKISESEISPKVRQTYTLTVMIIQTTVTKHLYLTDQFCGLVGSLGPSHVTIFASRVDSDVSVLGTLLWSSFGGGSWISSPPYRSKFSSPREIICRMRVLVWGECDWYFPVISGTFSEVSLNESEVEDTDMNLLWVDDVEIINGFAYLLYSAENAIMKKILFLWLLSNRKKGPCDLRLYSCHCEFVILTVREQIMRARAAALPSPMVDTRPGETEIIKQQLKQELGYLQAKKKWEQD
jgi:hypothetical protein